MTRTEAKTSSRRGRGTAPLYALAAPLALIVATATSGEALAAGLPSQLSSPLGAPGATVPDPLPMTALVKAIGASNRIDGLTVEELDDGTTVLHLKGSTKPTFNVYRLGEPDRLVVDLASAERGKVVPFAPLDTWACGRVSIDSVVERDAELVRVVVELKRDASYVVVPKDGTLVVTITPRQIAPEAYFARKTAGKRQLELQAKEKEVAAAERTAKALGIEAKLINTKAKKREQAAEKLAATARKRSAAAKKVESAALAAEKRALEAEKKAGDSLADAKSHRFRARRALKQAKAEREQAEQARAEAQAERKAADTARDSANAELRLAKTALDEERDKLIVARQRAEKAEARALVAKGQAESEKKEATKAKLRARKAEAAAKTAQASAEKKLATARADLARAKAAASRAEADAKSKLAKAERAAAAAEKASSSADKAAAKKLAAAAQQANKELEKARAKVTTAETKAATKLAAAEKAEREAKALLASARTKAKLEAAKVLEDANSKRAEAAKVLENADAERAKLAKQAKAEAAKLLADAGTKKSRAAALEKKAKQALSRAETAVAEAETERKAAAKARKQATAALAAAKTKAAAANASERAKAQREVETAQNAQKVARARYKQTEDAVAKLRKDRDSLKTKLAAQKKLSSDLEAKIKTRQSELAKLERKVANAKLAARKASTAAKAAEAATAAEVAKAAELAKATAAAKVRAAKAKQAKQVKPAKVKPTKPSPKLIAAEKALAQARVTATVLEKEVGRLRKDATAAETRARQAENKVASLERAGAAAAELDEARTAAKQAKAEAGSASVLLAKRKRKLGSVEKTLSEKRTAVAQLQKKHDALTKQNEAAAKALTATQSKHAVLSKKTAAAAKELTATQSKHAVLSKKTAAAAKELTATQSEYEALAKKNAAVADALIAKQSKHAVLAKKNEAATRELNAAQAELEQLRASLSAERSELAALTEDVENARASLDVRMAEAAEAEAAKKRALTEAEELERKNELARDQASKLALVEKAKKAKKAKQARVKDIRFEHDAKEQRVIVSVDGPMRFEGQSLTPTIKMLALDDAKLATKLERSLDASSYSGNIKTITSFAEGDATKVLVSTHGPSKARVEERAGELVWHFPTGPKRRKPAADGPEVVSMAGSKVAGYSTGPGPAKPIAAVPTTRMAAMAPPTNPGSGSRIPGTSGGSSQANVQPVTRRRTRWRGERIDIELQDAPIKDVLLLFADIGRVNIIAGNGVEGQVTMKLKAVPWDQALDTILRSLELGSTREGNVIRVATIDDLEAERKAAIDRANARVQLKPIETRIVPVSYATVDEMIPKVQNVLSPRGSVTPDTRTNQLVIMDVADNIAVAELLVNSLDTQTPQVLIEARIVEARTSFTRNLGIQWGFDFTASPGTGNPTGLLFPNSLGVGGGATGQPPDVRGLILPGAAANPNYAVDLPAPVGTGQGGALGFSFGSISGNLNTNLRLSAAESTGEVRIISAPKVVTLDNNEAQIETGVQIPISQVSAQGVNTRFVNATLSLRVTPQVTNEGAVLLDVQVQKNEADFVNTGARGDPTILTNQAQSRLLVNDADTAVIGGIYTRNKAVNFTKIPWLADIPIIGWFFKNKSEADTRSEILIFLTPKIVNRASSIGG